MTPKVATVDCFAAPGPAGLQGSLKTPRDEHELIAAGQWRARRHGIDDVGAAERIVESEASAICAFVG